MNIIKKLSLFLGVFALFGLSPLAFADDDGFDNEWTIIVKGKAENAGKVSFRLVYAPSDDGLAGDEEFIEASIPVDTSENDATKIIAAAFKDVLQLDDFNVDLQDGAKIQVEAKYDTPDFVIEVATNPVQGISFVIED
ncbi:MAG: hypothetical protein GY727_00260 [Gammaproteobacteria bacterium]|nr:hypothetical protein [Gammaproteobacteria bacterium]MCP4091014.1 hypothetical protein [Gammaproteobacteria bacterium]MCP4277460.1 hypothetical protein [Gammaproteobacteria bacterium]MCP4831479.1 hypothetical protein [Gammaproteobacteria bacterium]MCP4927702.1 hypothetical protein [Gammaproteobacteria bacterium]